MLSVQSVCPIRTKHTHSTYICIMYAYTGMERLYIHDVCSLFVCICGYSRAIGNYRMELQLLQMTILVCT